MPEAAADLAEHLHVVGGAHAQPLRLQQLAGPLKLGEPVGELGLEPAIARSIRSGPAT